MSKTFDFNQGDDLGDMLSGPAPVAPQTQPQGDTWERIRALDGAAPVAKLFKVNCTKCNGRGRFISYAGRDCGPCYTCKGKGHFERKNSATTLAANREKAMQRKVNAAQGNWDAFVEQFPAQAKVLTDGIAQTWGDGRWQAICSEIKGKVEKYGDLHTGTMAMLDRAVERAAQRAAQRAQVAQEKQEQVAGVNVANIVDCFRRAHEAGLKSFILRFDGVHFAVDKSTWDKVWVSSKGYGSKRYGVIENGVYRPGRDATPEIIAQIALISADPMAAAKAYVQITSHCCVCGKFLKNQDSVDAGMGPICAGRINRPGLKFVEVKEGVDF